MKFKKICKNKKVIKKILAVIGAIVITLSVGNSSYAQTKINENNNNIKVVDNMKSRKQIGIKNKKVASNSNSETITINGKSYKARKMNMKCTAYCNDPITATGVKPRPMHTVAVDPSLIKYGTKIYIPYFNTIFVAEDTGSAIRGKRLDIYLKTYNDCMQFGIQNLEVYILE